MWRMRDGAEETFWLREGKGENKLNKERQAGEREDRQREEKEPLPWSHIWARSLTCMILINFERLCQTTFGKHCLEVWHRALIFYLNALLRGSWPLNWAHGCPFLVDATSVLLNSVWLHCHHDSVTVNWCWLGDSQFPWYPFCSLI